MNTLKIVGCASLLFASIVSMADNKTGIYLYESGMYSASKAYFLKNINTLPQEDQAEAYYYLGESYMMLERTDSAKFYFQKGVAIAPEYPYNQIGLATFMLKTNAKEVEGTFKGLLSAKENKKDANIRLAIAQAYRHAGDKVKMNEYIIQAKQVASKDGMPYVLEGDILLSENESGAAAAKYDMALYFSPKLLGAYIKAARIYMNINRENSFDKITKAQEIAPEFIGINCILGEYYELLGNSRLAVEHYSQFMEAGYYDVEHLLKYAGLLHFDKQYEKMLPIVQSVLRAQPDNLVAKRLNAYGLAKITTESESLHAIKHFMETTPKESFIFQDFICYAEQLRQHKHYREALNSYIMALKKDESKKAIYLDIADLFGQTQQLDSAAQYYTHYFNHNNNPELISYLRFGRNYYTMANDSSLTVEQKNRLLQRADTVFIQITELAPTSHIGYLWRARANWAMDPETNQALAKPYYEKVLEIIQPERKTEIIESYKYLGYYHSMIADAITKANNDNPEKARPEYNRVRDIFRKVLELNPNDKDAKEIIEELKKLDNPQ